MLIIIKRMIMIKTNSIRKIQSGSYLSPEQKKDLENLKEKGYIKSISEGIRKAVSEWLRKPEVQEKLLADENQLQIIEFGNK